MQITPRRSPTPPPRSDGQQPRCSWPLATTRAPRASPNRWARGLPDHLLGSLVIEFASGGASERRVNHALYPRSPPCARRLSGRVRFAGTSNVRFWRISLKKAADEVAASNGRGGSLPPHAVAGVSGGISLASLRRFWAVAARRNSSLAPLGPRRRSRSSFRMRLRWANSISTFFRSRLETT